MAGGQVEVHPAAVEEARTARDWYSARSRLAGIAFGLELDLAVERITESPRRWPVHGNEWRRYVLRRFPFIVIYRDLQGVIQIIAVAHGRRRPGYWAERARS